MEHEKALHRFTSSMWAKFSLSKGEKSAQVTHFPNKYLLSKIQMSV